MSCIRFNTNAQREAMRHDAAALEAGDQAILHLSPPVTESKIARLRLLAAHDRAVRRALDTISALETVAEPPALIRIEPA